MIGHLWNLPNTLIGVVFGLGGRFETDVENRVFVVTGGWMAGIFGKLGYAGMCVGDVVLCAGPLSMSVYRHELVHAVQGRILGPLYLPLMGVYRRFSAISTAGFASPKTPTTPARSKSGPMSRAAIGKATSISLVHPAGEAV